MVPAGDLLDGMLPARVAREPDEIPGEYVIGEEP